MMCFQGLLVLHVCYALVTQNNAVFQLIFLTFVHRCTHLIFLCANVLNLNIDICSLLAIIYWVTMKPE